MPTKQLYQLGSAAGTGVVAEYTKRAANPTLGVIMAAALGTLGYLLAPTATGNMAAVTVGLMDGAASWLGANVIAPILKTKTAGLFAEARPAPPRLPAPVPVFGSPSVGVSSLEI